MDKGYYQNKGNDKTEARIKSQSTIEMDKGYYKKSRAGLKTKPKSRNPQ